MLKEKKFRDTRSCAQASKAPTFLVTHEALLDEHQFSHKSIESHPPFTLPPPHPSTPLQTPTMFEASHSTSNALLFKKENEGKKKKKKTRLTQTYDLLFTICPFLEFARNTRMKKKKRKEKKSHLGALFICKLIGSTRRLTILLSFLFLPFLPFLGDDRPEKKKKFKKRIKK